MNGPVSYLSVCCPTTWDMNNFPHIHLIDASAEWKAEELFNISSVVSTNTELACIDSSLTSYSNTIIFHGICKLFDVKSLTPEYLSTLWHITLEDAKNIIRVTTQRTIRTSEGMKPYRFKTVLHQSLYKHLGNDYLNKFCSDTFISKLPSLTGNRYAQLFVYRGDFNQVISCKADLMCLKPSIDAFMMWDFLQKCLLIMPLNSLKVNGVICV